MQSSFVTSGNTVTVDGSALGSSDSLVFAIDSSGTGASPTGNHVLLGGAGDDVLEGSLGNTIFNGGGGNNTVSFQQDAGGIVADLSNTGPQNFGAGTGTFINIQNLIGSPGSDILTGDANNNSFTISTNASVSYGNDIVGGGAGSDTAVFAGARSAYTITSAGGTTTLVSAYWYGHPDRH